MALRLAQFAINDETGVGKGPRNFRHRARRTASIFILFYICHIDWYHQICKAQLFFNDNFRIQEHKQMLCENTFKNMKA